jgi:hypothetical protein
MSCDDDCDSNDPFNSCDEEFLHFERIPEAERLHPRPDICGLMYIHQKFGGANHLITGATHDKVYLECGLKDILKLDQNDLVYLHRCGVIYDDEGECLGMYC